MPGPTLSTLRRPIGRLAFESATRVGPALFPFFWLPVGWPRFDGAVTEALALTKWYAREHVLVCLVPAFFFVEVGIYETLRSTLYLI